MVSKTFAVGVMVFALIMVGVEIFLGVHVYGAQRDPQKKKDSLILVIGIGIFTCIVFALAALMMWFTFVKKNIT